MLNARRGWGEWEDEHSDNDEGGRGIGSEQASKMKTSSSQACKVKTIQPGVPGGPGGGVEPSDSQPRKPFFFYEKNKKLAPNPPT